MSILLAKLRTPKKKLSQNRPVEGPFIVSNSWPNSFYRQRINPQIFAGFFFATSFQPFWRGIARLQVFFWPFGKTAHHFFANITVKPPPPQKKRSVGNSTRAPLVCCGNSAMAPRLAFKVKHVLSQKWRYTLSSTYKHSTDLGCKKGNPTLFFYESSSY